MTNVENMRKWVAALRSGKYERGTGALHDPIGNTYCCLGVACEISGLGYWQPEWDGISPLYVTPNSRHSGILPAEVADWLGLDPNDCYADESALHPSVVLDEKAAYLMTVVRQGRDSSDEIIAAGEPHAVAPLNDSNQFSFEDIADLIEATYLPQDRN